MMIHYSFSVIGADGAGIPGLSPSWQCFKKLENGQKMTGPPIGDIGDGDYKFAWDSELGGDAIGTIDASSSLPSELRYIRMSLTGESGILFKGARDGFPLKGASTDTGTAKG